MVVLRWPPTSLLDSNQSLEMGQGEIKDSLLTLACDLSDVNDASWTLAREANANFHPLFIAVWRCLRSVEFSPQPVTIKSFHVSVASAE
ncbi:hypothetical protein C0Q70_06222 [Pomacea canaliculata]|uniref:Uncharacterized protein n=1 Tax=Pomacea canaliculata TaxID=400727 RepID=A0A2T7PND9_POMCA|nr:hypothetical protein C0Q70_06222 [Pomacea canaliculata]